MLQEKKVGFIPSFPPPPPPPPPPPSLCSLLLESSLVILYDWAKQGKYYACHVRDGVIFTLYPPFWMGQRGGGNRIIMVMLGAAEGYGIINWDVDRGPPSPPPPFSSSSSSSSFSSPTE